MSSSVCSSFQALLMPPRQKMRFFVFIHSNKFLCFPPRFVASFTNDDSLPLPKPSHPPFDSSVDLYGLIDPRNVVSGAPEPRSWFGPNGQYIKELPCPSCRGRGYTPCTECGIERSRLDCSVCNGKGAVTCHQCSGNRVIWEEFIDERPWETARSISPLRMKEDDEVDNLDIKLEEKKKSKRVYQSPPPEVGLKISRSLKSLNAKTGLFSKRMKIIHRDPTLHAQRVAAIKKAKGSAEARKRTSEALKAFFSDPENRRKRSISMKGVKFYCNNCGREGHRRYYCPELKGDSVDRRFRCRVCGEKGHNKRTCKKSRLNNKTNATMQYHCRICGVKGHNRRTCLKSELSKPKGIGRHYRCGICRQNGHYRQNCPNKSGLNLINVDRTVNQNSRVRQSHCRICNKKGHNQRKCPNVDGKANHSTSRRAYSCKLCNEKGHNSRTCHSRNVNDSQKNPPVNLIE